MTKTRNKSVSSFVNLVSDLIRHSGFVILVLLLALFACSRPAAHPRLPPTGDFPAFGGGGAMHNLAGPIDAPPMKVRWTFQASDELDGAPVIAGDSAYVADASGELTALDLAGGKKRWTFQSDSGFDATPLVDGGMIYIGDQAGNFDCLNAATGKLAWSVNVQAPMCSGANGDGKHILLGTQGGQIFCLDHAGKTLWTAQADAPVNAPPSIENGLAAFTSCDMHLRLLRIDNGQQIFKTDLGNLAPGSACATDKTLFVGTDGGHVLALSIKDGSTQWHFDKIADQAMVYASPALADGTLVIAARDNNVYALNAGDGTRKWRFATGAGIDASPVISAGRVYVPSQDRRLCVLSLADGKLLWTFETARMVSAPVAIGRGVLVMGDKGGTVYCLEGQ